MKTGQNKRKVDSLLALLLFGVFAVCILSVLLAGAGTYRRLSSADRHSYDSRTAAETGHTLIATLHTKGAVNSIDRIIDAFPSTQQAQLRVQLAEVLRTVVSQQLLPDASSGMVPAYEIMHMTSAIRSLIRDNKTHQIENAITSGSREGMLSMDQSILALYREGAITRETALEYADNPEQLRRSLS